MPEFVNIFVEIPIDSEVYKNAVELFEKNKDLGLSILSSPEKILQNCLELGSIPHILRNIDILSCKADELRKKNN